MSDIGYCPKCNRQWVRLTSSTICPYCDVLLVDERVSRTANGGSAEARGSALAEDMAMLIRRLCRVVARHDANNTVRGQALDYLHRHNLGGSPLKGKAPNS